MAQSIRSKGRVFRQLQFAPAIFWLISSWPGYMNSDAYLVFDEARKNSFSNWHPVAFGLLMKLSIIFTQSPFPLLICQMLLVVWSLNFLLRSMKFSSNKRAVFIFVFFILPTVGVFVATLGKDVFFMCALFAVTGAILNLREESQSTRDLLVLSIGIFSLCVLRWNGPLIGLATLVVFVIGVRRTKLRLSATILSCLAGCIFLVVAPFSNNRGGQDIADVGKHLDIAWLLKEDPSVFSSGELDVLNYVAPIQRWIDSQANCDVSVMPLIWGVFTVDQTAAAHLAEKRHEIATIWSKHVRTNTLEIIKGRTCRSRGLVGFRSLYPPMEAQTSNDVLKQWYFVESPALYPALQTFGVRITEWWRFLPNVTAFGQPLLPTFLLVVRLVMSRMSRKLLIPGLLASAGVISIAAAGTGVEPRYLYPSVFLMWITVLSPKASTRKHWGILTLPHVASNSQN
jgi:hypothetical protein